ncbi:hypothetical protein H9649_14015 [Sporosarcina sp. Sa2YVA2]|uniref:Uncharacterized protein n=1 Tax=Sporosarcina quadrami TaxID=2762234 RepID=A0ABR8UCF0_9BACL|nr:hypothetical protein [Sporosarcina quadrami]MBD7985707.1 hypothetical protein [Sporosarcina quadrami]
MGGLFLVGVLNGERMGLSAGRDVTSSEDDFTGAGVGITSAKSIIRAGK